MAPGVEAHLSRVNGWSVQQPQQLLQRRSSIDIQCSTFDRRVQGRLQLLSQVGAGRAACERAEQPQRCRKKMQNTPHGFQFLHHTPE